MQKSDVRKNVRFQNHFYVVFYNIKIKVEWLDYNNSIVVPVPLCHHLSCLFKTSISGQPFSSTIPGPPLIKNIKKIGLHYKMELFIIENDLRILVKCKEGASFVCR